MALKAHVSFALPFRIETESPIISLFTRNRYRLIEANGTQQVFMRGSKLSAFFRFDIRAYHTVLKVRTATQPNGGLFVSCDWEVFTFMTVTTGADVYTLEAEGKELESVLRSSEEQAWRDDERKLPLSLPPPLPRLAKNQEL